ncbi:hypothetical protein SVIO_027090 [Streptomyces violaceusniger]|uniref:Uncharacterized protein n=1 Tax=Streptomyces violaceusniger TaxID=68280 RepID=A0A4D4KYW8_STRVO|nr:hypothetical protein SVIO_027090 [Streptomyces violaceusniger]
MAVDAQWPPFRLSCPRGQVACSLSQSTAEADLSKPPPLLAWWLWSGTTGPSRVIPWTAGAFDPGRGGVGGIDDVFGRGQAGVGEVVVDLFGEFAVLDRGDRGGHVDDYLGPVGVTGLG